MKSILSLQHIFSLLFLNFGFSSSDGNSEGQKSNQWFNPSSHKTIHGFDLSQVEDLEDIDHLNGGRNGATVTDSSGNPLLTGLYSGPYFDLEEMKIPREFMQNGGDVLSGRTNITTQIGSSAILPCVVKQVGSNTVSWVRKRDSHILTVDKTVFISDPRFRILRLEESGNDWDLHIKPVRQRDIGFYECQISTINKMSFRVYLNVIVPDVIIEGSPDIHAQSGSSVTLKCLIKNAIQEPNAISWYKDNKRLHPNSRTLMVSHVTDKRGGQGSKRQLHHYQNLLTLESVRLEHRGLYSCVPSSGLPNATVNLHVVKARTLAGVSDDHRSSNEEEGKDGESKRKSSSLTTNQNQKIKPGLTSGGFSIYGIDRIIFINLKNMVAALSITIMISQLCLRQRVMV